MTIHRRNDLAVAVNDHSAAKAFYLEYGLEVQWEGELERACLDFVAGLKNLKTAIVVMRTPQRQPGFPISASC